MPYALTRDVPKFLNELSVVFKKHGMVLCSREKEHLAYKYNVLSFDTGRFMEHARFIEGKLEITEK